MLKRSSSVPEPPVIAPLGFFQAMQVFVELFLGEKARAVDALQLRVALLALPVRARNVHQLERLDFSRGRDVRPAAEIDEFSGGVKRHHRLGRLFLHQFALESLIGLAVQLDRFRLGHQLALVGHVLRGDLVHLLLDALQVFRRERLLAQEFVEKSVVNRRPDAQFHVGKKLQHRRGKQVRRRMAKHLQRVGILRTSGSPAWRRVRSAATNRPVRRRPAPPAPRAPAHAKYSSLPRPP